MARFEVYVRRVEWGAIEIEADSEQEAKNEAFDAMCEGLTKWGHSEEVFWLPSEAEPERTV